MSEVLLTVDVMPEYGQVRVEDAGSGDVPQWETGEERFVSTAQTILVNTREDVEGPVQIKVLRGEGSGQLGHLIFDGELTLASGRIAVGDVLGDTNHEVDLNGARETRVRIFGDKDPFPGRLEVLLS